MCAVLNATDTAYYLHLTEEEILELVKLGHIPYKKLGETLLFLIRDLDAWLDALPGVPVWEALARAHEEATSPVSTIPNRQTHRKEVKHARAG